MLGGSPRGSDRFLSNEGGYSASLKGQRFNRSRLKQPRFGSHIYDEHTYCLLNFGQPYQTPRSWLLHGNSASIWKRAIFRCRKRESHLQRSWTCAIHCGPCGSRQSRSRRGAQCRIVASRGGHRRVRAMVFLFIVRDCASIAASWLQCNQRRSEFVSYSDQW